MLLVSAGSPLPASAAPPERNQKLWTAWKNRTIPLEGLRKPVRLRNGKADLGERGGVELEDVLVGDLVKEEPGDEIVLRLYGNTTGGNYSGTIFLVLSDRPGKAPRRLAELWLNKYTDPARYVETASLQGAGLVVSGMEVGPGDADCCPSKAFKATYRLTPTGGKKAPSPHKLVESATR
jgi:hypothetical protein